MDKFAANGWFMKFTALIMALLLFLSVNYDPHSRKAGTPFDTPSQTETDTVKDVPVEVYYDVENLIVSGIPNVVDVKLEGPKSLVIMAKNKRDFQLYIDLSDPVIGPQRVPIKIKDLSDKLKAKITPMYANVVVEEKVTKEFPVTAEFDESALAEGYRYDSPVIDPAKVTITGAKSMTDKIAFVKATVETDNVITKDIHKSAPVVVLDKNLRKLDVEVKPSTVNVSIDIKSPSKEVSLKPVAKGTASDGITIESMSIKPEKATVYGVESVLSRLSQIEVPVEIGNIKDDTTLSIPFSLPDGVVGASVDTVEVHVKVKKENGKTVTNIPIEARNLNEHEYDLRYLDSTGGLINLFVTGELERIRPLSANDFEVYFNAGTLDEGKHRIALNVMGPKDIRWSIPSNTRHINVELVKKDPEG